jgi:hypothetical protein
MHFQLIWLNLELRLLLQYFLYFFSEYWVIEGETENVVFVVVVNFVETLGADESFNGELSTSKGTVMVGANETEHFVQVFQTEVALLLFDLSPELLITVFRKMETSLSCSVRRLKLVFVTQVRKLLALVQNQLRLL